MSDRLDGYCDRNGAHYIGDADTCWRCDLMRQRRTEEQVFFAVMTARALKNRVRSE